MEKQCTREDLRVEIVMSTPVSDNGEAVTTNLSGIYDIETNNPYYCTNCDFDCESVEQLLEHLPKEAA
jgi:hypothetical protein